MNKLSTILLVCLTAACSSDSPKPEIVDQVDDEVIVEQEQEGDEEESKLLFTRITLFSFEGTGESDNGNVFEINLFNDKVAEVKNLSVELGLDKNVQFNAQSKTEALFTNSFFVEDVGLDYKVVSYSTSSMENYSIGSYLNFVDATESPSFLQVTSNNNQIYGLHKEEELKEGALVKTFVINQINKSTGELEIFWSFEDEVSKDLDLEIGVGFPNTGISASKDFLHLSYGLFDTEGPIGGGNTIFHIDVYDIRTKEIVQSFNSSEPLGLIYNGDFLCLKIENRLELHNLKTGETSVFENEDLSQIIFGKPSYGFVSDDKLIFTSSSNSPGMGIELINVLNFNSGQVEFLQLTSIKEQLHHIPADVFINSESFSVQFEEKLYFISYSYEIEGAVKSEIMIINFDGQVLDYITTPTNDEIKGIFVN